MPQFIPHLKSAIAATCISCSFALLLPLPGQAQDSYPDKAVRLVVPFAAGGPSDVLGRIVAAGLSSAMGETFFVDNRGGSGGNIGAAAVARAPADGYTLLLGTVGTHAINKALYSNLPYDPIKDFAPISLIADLTNIMVVNANFAKANKIGNAGDFLHYARAHVGALNAASAGSGTSSHLAVEVFNNMTGVRLAHVPYRGSGPAVLDLMAGSVDVMFDSPLSALPHVKEGKLKALAITSAQRSPAFPDLPTVGETPDLKGYAVGTWFGLFAPAGTPPAIVDKIQAALVKVMNSPDVKNRLISQGASPHTTTPREFAELIKSDIVRWDEVVRTSGAKVD